MLRVLYPESEWGLAFEVYESTAGTGRRADAVAMSYWRTRGNHIHGFEFKTSRPDWRRERKNGAKAEGIAKRCDFWWLVATPQVVKPGELPDSWGLMEAHDGALRIIKEAPKMEPVAFDRAFASCLFRRLSVADSDVFNNTLEARIDAARAKDRRQWDESRKREIDAIQWTHLAEVGKYESVQKWMAEFEACTGLSAEDLLRSGDNFTRAVKMVLDAGAFGSYKTIERLRDDLLETVQRINRAIGPDSDSSAEAS